jgi:diguanylate cyclase (GGDEF)-like protein
MSANTLEIGEFHWLFDVLQSLEVGLIVLDMDFKVQVWNGFMENHSGINGASIHGKPMFDFFNNLPRDWLEQKIGDAIALKTAVFSTWEQREFLFSFKATRPFTGMSEYMYQNITIMPLKSVHGGISHICIIIYDVTESATNQLGLYKANEQLRQLSITDGLTKLYNRAYWQECLFQEYNRFKRKPIDVTLMMLDIDFFKKVNDTYGHPAGDAVLRKLSETLKSHLRSTDVAGRYGGEEFAIILLDSDILKSITVAERLRKTVEGIVIHYEDKVIRFTVSIGLCQLEPGIPSEKEWLVNTDNCLYYSKKNGRNQVTAFGVTDMKL